MNSKQVLAVLALTASVTSSLNALAQYETDVMSAKTMQEILAAYQRNDLVKIENYKKQISALNHEIRVLEMQRYGVDSVGNFGSKTLSTQDN